MTVLLWVIDGLPLWLTTSGLLMAYLLVRSQRGNLRHRSLSIIARGSDRVCFGPSATCGPRWDRFALSVSLHFVLLAALPRMVEPVPLPMPPSISEYEIVTVQNRIPVFTTPELPWPRDLQADSGPKNRPRPNEAAGVRNTPQTAEAGLEAMETESNAATSPETVDAHSETEPKRRDEGRPQERAVLIPIFPTTPETPPLRDVVLHPDFEVPFVAEQGPKLPPVLVWTLDPPPLIEKPVVEPVQASEPVVRWSLPSGMGVRRPEPAKPLAELGVGPAPTLAEQPLLKMPSDALGQWPMGVAPSTAAAPPTLSQEQGKQALLVLPNNPQVPSESFDLPQAFRLGSQPWAGAVHSEATSDRSDTDEGRGTPGSGSSSSTSGSSALPKRSLPDKKQDNRPNSHSRTLSKPSDSDAAQGTPKNESRMTSSEADADSHSVPGGEPLRPVPRGQHGIILVSNSLTTVPEAQGLLTGNPIYTVYLNVPNAAKKWTLQFCVPKSQSRQMEFQADGVIRIIPRKQISPPYAIHTQGIPEAPEDMQASSRIPRIVVFFTLNEHGKIGGLRFILGRNDWAKRVIPSTLSSWRFLPAFQGQTPVAVQALMTIPIF